MSTARIVLTGLGSKLAGLTWESDQQLRIGRQGNLDVVLRDFSVDRLHAEVKNLGYRWVLRDLANNPHYPTQVNGSALAGKQQVLRNQDIIQVGKLLLKVVDLQVLSPEPTASTKMATSQGQDLVLSGLRRVNVAAASQQSWDQAVEKAVIDPAAGPPSPSVLTLLRANHHLSRLSNLDDLLNSILADVGATLSAQRGSIILADPATGALTMRAIHGNGSADPGARLNYSKTLIDRCFKVGESLLCQDSQSDRDLFLARSVRQGTMSSIICALLRTPRNRLGVLHLDRGPLQEPFTESDLYLADGIAATVAVGIESAQLLDQQRAEFLQAVTTLARTVEMRDPYTGDHTRRVTDYALLLADELELPKGDRYLIQVGTPLHDIGKIGIDDAILRKPGKLTAEEFDAMKAHTTKGASILDAMHSLAPMVPIVKHHHERWDGAGYPNGLGRDDIPLTARIVAVADAFDAMTSHRPYRPAFAADRAFHELIGQAGLHFDPRCVQAFLQARRRVEAVLQK